jgi:hypothetical protein
VVLEHHAAFRPRTLDFPFRQQQDALGRLGQAGDQIQQGGFAATGMADQRDELALFDIQVDVGAMR